MSRVIPLIEPKFANRIADRYVSIYKTAGFKEARAYLDFIVKGDVTLREHLVPIIITKGEER